MQLRQCEDIWTHSNRVKPVFPSLKRSPVRTGSEMGVTVETIAETTHGRQTRHQTKPQRRTDHKHRTDSGITRGSTWPLSCWRRGGRGALVPLTSGLENLKRSPGNAMMRLP